MNLDQNGGLFLLGRQLSIAPYLAIIAANVAQQELKLPCLAHVLETPERFLHLDNQAVGFLSQLHGTMDDHHNILMILMLFPGQTTIFIVFFFFSLFPMFCFNTNPKVGPFDGAGAPESPEGLGPGSGLAEPGRPKCKWSQLLELLYVLSIVIVSIHI